MSETTPTSRGPGATEREPKATAEWTSVGGNGTGVGPRDATHVPLLPDLAPGGDAAQASAEAAALQSLRGFHFGGDGGALRPPAEDVLPALLWQFAGADALRSDYPLLLDATDGAAPVRPLSQVLELAVERQRLGRVFGDNLVRLERTVRGRLAARRGQPVEAAELLRMAGGDLERELGLAGELADQLRADVTAVIDALPQEAALLGFGDHADLALFVHAVRCHLLPRRKAFKRQVEQLVGGLSALLGAEEQHQPGARAASVIGASIGDAGARMVDPAALARVLGPPRGAEPMLPARRQRIEEALRVLEGYAASEPPLLALMHEQALPSELLALVDGETLHTSSACGAAVRCFDELAHAFAEVVRAVRVARLELAVPHGAYDPTQHDSWLAGLSWQGFAQGELLLMPVVAASTREQTLAAGGMPALSRVLLSGRPVQVLVRVRAEASPVSVEEEDPLASFRLELGYLGIGHRVCAVRQSASSRPGHLTRGFVRTLGSTRSSLHVLLNAPVQRPSAIGGLLRAGAAVEARAHPLFGYDPETGVTWARRFELDENPASEDDWAVHSLVCRTAAGDARELSIAFTFADFALLQPSYRDAFRVVPDTCGESGQLVPIDAYLKLAPDEEAQRVPFLWAIDHEGRLVRLAISRRLAVASRDRLGFWRTLQELAGLRNEHVEVAVARAREEARAELEREREQLQAQHAEEVERVRGSAAGEAMDRLAAALTGLDASSLTMPAPGAPPAVAPPAVLEPLSEAPAQVSSPPAEMAADDDDLTMDEAWIDSALCTSCNDCLAINQKLFVYNENRQARIGDLAAGTFAHLVQAAERCPARCIHPGKPSNPDEPHLEQLIERAKPFN